MSLDHPDAPRSGRWATLERLYHEALTLDVGLRKAFLIAGCAGDDALLAEVESLLAHDGGAAFLETPAPMVDEPSGLSPGTVIGSYEVVESIGEGGIGEVYRARDHKLERDVAIKIIPLAFSAEPDRLARFEREARMLAALNHPHIGAIYGVEEFAGGEALVLEFVEGETLAHMLGKERRRGGGLPLHDVILIAKQIATALEAAHDRGIVHRDLKPANIKIAPGRHVKVLDFGLAKAADAVRVDGAADVSLAGDGLSAGLILGTAAYMSPEQARGQATDKRTDIWAFGCVVYELLTGRRAFAGETMSDTIASVLTGEPDWTALPAATPPGVMQLLQRCLTKDPFHRLRDIGDARIALETNEHAARPTPPGGHSRWWPGRLVTAAVLTAVVVGVMGLWGVLRSPSTTPAPPQVVRFSVMPPPGTRFLHTVATTFPALSPDGTQLALIALTPPRSTAIWLRPIAGLDARLLPGTEGASSMFWSPDGREIAFFSGDQLKRISVAGGAAIMICRVPAAPSNGTWSSDGTILFASLVGDGIFRVSSAGGTPASIVTPDASLDEQVVWPSFLPDGKRFLYLSQRANSTGYIMLSEPGGRAPRPVTAAISNVQWIEPGYLVFAQEGVLVAQRFEDASGQISGPPIPIAERVDLFLSTGRALFTASRTGTIAYDSFANVARLEWIDRKGRELGTVAGAGNYLTVRLSRDDRTALFQRTKASTGTWDVYTADLTRGVETQVTLDPGSEAYPVWMPDERDILFGDGRNGGTLNLALKHFDSGIEDRLLPAGPQRRPMDVRGDTVLYTERSLEGTLDVWRFELSNPEGRTRLFGSPAHEADPRFSPDGRAMTFTSDVAGRFEVWIAPFPPTGGRVQVSSAGIYPGVDLQQGARWSRDGREILYVAADRRLMSVPVRTTPRIEVGTPVPLFETGARAWEDFAVSGDGQRFLAVVPQALAGEQPLTVIVNWTADSKP